jgi:capsid protein
MRNISFSMTESQFLDGSKDVTRRLGWLTLQAGDHLMACRKCQGLKPGEKINTVKAEQPGTVYAEFVRSRLRASSAGSCMSYETFSNDYSQGSFASTRQSLIQERAMFRIFSGLLDRKLNIPMYRWFMDSQELVRAVVMPGYDTDPRRYWPVKFSRPRQEWIDPAKEATAAEKRLSIGMETLTNLCEAEGNDVDEVLETRAAEVARMKALGIFQLDKPPQQPEPELVGDDEEEKD